MSQQTLPIIQQLETYFEALNHQQETVQAGNKHVFQACMEHLEDNLDFEQKMTLVDYHLCYNKALEGARSGNLDASTRWLEKAEQLSDFEEETLQRVVAVNKVPAIAYHLYREGDYEKAVKLLKETIHISGELAEKDGIDYMVWGQMEDYINIFRVFCTAKDQARAIQYAQSILLAAVHGQLTPNVVEDVSPSLLRKAEIDFISYATSDIIARLLKFEGLAIEEVVIQIFSPLWEIEDWSNCPLEGYKNAIFALKYWSKGETAAFLEEVEALLPTIGKQSSALQFCILEALLPVLKSSIIGEDGKALLMQISGYYLKELNIDTHLLEHHSQFQFVVNA